MTTVTYFLRDNGGCGYYRAFLPFSTVKKNAAMNILQIERGDTAEKIGDYLDKCDVFLVPRIREGLFLKSVQGYMELGKKLVIDWDDDIFNVSPLSPHYEAYGTEEFSMSLRDIPGFYFPDGSLNKEKVEFFQENKKPMIDLKNERLYVWKDGVNINLKQNRLDQEEAREACRRAHMITVTTDILANVYRQFNDNVVVLPNCIDINRWKKLPLRSHAPEIRMGWFGGHSHYEDWLLIAPIIPKVMKRFPNLKLIIQGAHFPGTLKGIDPKRIEIHPWEHTFAYPFKSAILDLDFAIIPLQDTTFNNSKSAIKWIEMASLHVPSVTSYVSPYAEMMDLVPENGIFISENNLEGWERGIYEMVTNEGLRGRMAEAAHQTVEKFFDINTQYHQWVNAYQEVLTWRPRQTRHAMSSSQKA